MSEVDTKRPMLETPQPPSQNIKQYLAAVSVSLGAFCAGTVLSWTSPGLSHILQDFTNETSDAHVHVATPGFRVTEREGALIGAMLTFGALMSAIPTGYCADKFGRKPVILALSIPFLLSYLLISFAACVEIVIAGRFLAGVGLGGICVVAPMYLGEVAEARNRGTFGSFLQMFLSCGILFTCIIGWFANWLWLSLTLAVAPVAFGVTFLFMPETPVHLVEKNKLEAAEASLRDLRGSRYDVSAELKAIQREMQAREKTASVIDVITNKANLRAMISAVGVLAFQQLSGINAVVFYTASIFQAAGTDMSPNLSAVIINLVQVIVSYLSIVIIEKANRKFYLMLSSVGMLLCLSGLGMFFHLKTIGVNVDHLGFVPLASTVLFMVSFSFGYGPVPWMLMSELFSPEIKGIASGVAILTNWMFAFLVTFSFPILNADLGAHVTFYGFAGVMACGTVFVYFVVPETRGKSLAEIQEALNS